MTRKCPLCEVIQKHTPYGHFVRASDNVRVKRFKCPKCFYVFSKARFQACYRQRKRKLNGPILFDYCSGMSLRRLALKYKIDRKTLKRRVIFLANQKRIKNQKCLKLLKPISQMQFDDLETFEHTKCKPLSITLAVQNKTRRILDFQVSQMPAKGHLAKIAFKKYGLRRDLRTLGRRELFSRLKEKVLPTALIESDENPHYKHDIKEFFPQASHIAHLGKRGSIVGQGELKKVRRDPLFSLNHTCAMLRANINRLFRKTWCTTKDPQRLKDHLEIYVWYHNEFLLKNPA